MTKRKTVKVRIAVAVDEEGDWNVEGRAGVSAECSRREVIAKYAFLGTPHVYMIEADVPLPPSPKTIKAKGGTKR